MMRYMRLLAAILAAALLLTLALTGCAREPDENEALLQQQWVAVLDANERMNSSMLWAFEYAQAFTQDNSWESMQKARAACCSVIQALYDLELPENTMTQEQLTALMDKGVEADVVVMELDALKTELGYKLTTMRCLLYLLRDDVYLAPSAEKIGPWIRSNQDHVLLQSEYLALTTNYLLLQMADRSLWDTMPERFTVTGRFCGAWEADPGALQLESDRVLDEMALQLDAEAGYLGIAEYTLQLVRDAVESGDLKPLADALHTMEGVPAWIPMPEWLPQDILWFYLTEDEGTGTTRLVEAGEDLAQGPDVCYIPCDGITLEDVRGYEQRLDFWGVDHYGKEEDGGYDVLVDGGGSDMLVSWTPEQTVLFLTGDIACLMPELYLGAMMTE